MMTKLLAEHAQQQDLVREEVQVAYARIEASQQALTLYRERLLPAAEANLAAARAAYISGSVDFLGLTSARREFITHQMGFQRTLAEYYRSRAELERAVGAPLLPSQKLPEPALPITD